MQRHRDQNPKLTGEIFKETNASADLMMCVLQGSNWLKLRVQRGTVMAVPCLIEIIVGEVDERL